MYKIFFLVLAPFLTCFAQTKSTITCKVNNCEDGTTVFVYSSVGKFRNSVYSETGSKIENGQFTVMLNQQIPAFVTLKSKCFKAEVFVEPGETIGVDITVKNGRNEIHFQGKNAAALELYNTNPYPSGKIDRDIDSILAKSVTVQQAVQGMTALIDRYRRPYEEMYNNANMSNRLYEIISADIEAMPVFLYANRVIASIVDTSGRERIITPLDKAAQAKLVSALYAKYDPFQPRYLGTFAGSAFLITRCASIQFGLAPGIIDTTAGWRRDMPQLWRYAYAPKSHQELLLGNSLLLSIVNGYLPADTLKKQFAAFSRSFPQSPYNPVIKQQLLKPGDKQMSGDAYISYSAATDTLKFILLRDKMEDLSTLVNTLFKGKPVFVDCWATWCSPCVAEFKYAPELNAFLKRNGIGLLYLSFDKQDSRVYLPAIRGYKLDGYHYLANKGIDSSIHKIANTAALGIPRYLLYDKDGQLVEDSTYRPSDGQKLFSQIKEKLKLP